MYPKVLVNVETLESIIAGKLRAMVQRKMCRDYYDVWRALDLKVDLRKVKKTFRIKCSAKGIEFYGTKQMFPDDLTETLRPYWEKELGRLLGEVPKMEEVIEELRSKLPEFLSG